MLVTLQKPGLHTRSGTLYLSKKWKINRGKCTDDAVREFSEKDSLSCMLSAERKEQKRGKKIRKQKKRREKKRKERVGGQNHASRH